MKENKKKKYDAPMVELLEARVEKGFQSSGSRVGPRLDDNEGNTLNGDVVFS